MKRAKQDGRFLRKKSNFAANHDLLERGEDLGERDVEYGDQVCDEEDDKE